MEFTIVKPNEIEQKSFAMITEMLAGRKFPEEQESVIKRVIHTTADFDYADTLYFSKNAVAAGLEALQKGATVITDTNMALAGVNKSILAQLHGNATCFIASEAVAEEARKRQVTRATVSMEHAATLQGPLIFAIGNAPTALIALHELIKQGAVQPALVIGVPVGFVNVVESKELFVQSDIPCILSRGRKGGSNVAAAIVNALLYKIVSREGF